MFHVLRVNITLWIVGEEAGAADVGAGDIHGDTVVEDDVLAYTLELRLDVEPLPPLGQTEDPLDATALGTDEAQLGLYIRVGNESLHDLPRLRLGSQVVDVDNQIRRSADEAGSIAIAEGSHEGSRLEVQLLEVAQLLLRGALSFQLAQLLSGMARLG